MRRVLGVPSRRRCVAAAGTGWEGGSRRRARKGTSTPLHIHPLPTSLPFPGSRSPDPYPGLLCPPSPNILSSVIPCPTDPRGRRRGSRLCPCPAGAWDRVGDAGRDLGLLGEGCLLPPRSRGGELGEGAGQGRKRAAAVFAAALPSGTDGWGGERVYNVTLEQASNLDHSFLLLAVSPQFWQNCFC